MSPEILLSHFQPACAGWSRALSSNAPHAVFTRSAVR